MLESGFSPLVWFLPPICMIVESVFSKNNLTNLTSKNNLTGKWFIMGCCFLLISSTFCTPYVLVIPFIELPETYLWVLLCMVVGFVFFYISIQYYRSPENDQEPSNTDENHDVNQGSNGHDEAPRVQRSRRARSSSAISHGLSVLFPICQSVDTPARTRTISRTSSVNQAPIAGCLPIFGRSRSASGTPPARIPTRTPEYTRTPTRSASGRAPARISACTPEYPHTPTSSASGTGTTPARIPGYPHTPALTSVTAPSYCTYCTSEHWLSTNDQMQWFNH